MSSTLDTAWLDAVTLQRHIAAGELSAVAVTEQALQRLQALDGPLHAFLYVDAEGALAQAAAVDRARARGASLGSLAGVPVALKDNLCTRGVPTTCASRLLAGYIPPYDADVVERLRKAGAVMLGKTNMDEFAMGSSNENSAFGPTRNPWDLTRAPGGSSGGSAAATAGGLATLALGSDTGGSVRQPAAFCGVVALKPTYGRISRYGLVAFASSLDQIGPFARSARDAARLLGVLAGVDRRDATSVDVPVPDYEQACSEPLGGLRIGVLRDELIEGLEPEMAACLEQTCQALRDSGCSVSEVSLPTATAAVSVYYILAPAEASSNLARFDGVRYGLRVESDHLGEMMARTRAQGFGAEVKRRIMLGTYVLSAGYYDAYYLKAQRVRTLICDDYRQAFAHCDAILTPTTPTPAFRLGEKLGDPLAMYLADIFTLPPSLAGLPAINVPCGMTSERLPIGMQLTAPAFAEGRLLQLAAALETAKLMPATRPELAPA